MFNCELFSIRKSKNDYIALEENFELLSILLRERDLDVRYKTDVSADPQKLAQAITSSMQDETTDIFLFMNALNTSDASSFKSLFYEFIDQQEAQLVCDPAHEGMTPKIKVFSLGDMGCGYKGYCFTLRDKLFIALPYASLCNVNAETLILEGVRKARLITAENSFAYPGGIAFLSESQKRSKSAHSKPKESFLMSFIPHKGDSRASIIRKSVVLVAIAAFIVALAIVLNIFVFAPMQNNKITAEIQNVAHRQDTDATSPDGEKLPAQDWDALKKLNKEIVGWIQLEGTVIDYPVMFHKGDDQNSQYYLKHTYKHEYSEYGTVFIDYRSKKSTDSKNVILHGHNMLDGSMFHELMNYADGLTGNLKYYQKHPVFTFNTPDGDAKWKVISVFKTSTLYAHGEFFNYMQGEFNSDAEFMNFVYNVRIRSLFNIPVMVNEDDQLLTLSTCSYEFTNFRTVVVARKVRPGEDESVDVQLAELNPSPLFPDVYYNSRGGTRPDPLTFKTANAKGLVNWYDGKGKLEGAEDLTATIAANPTEPPTKKKGETTPTKPPVITYYSVTYRNYDGSEYASYSVEKGTAVPTPDGTPTMPEDNSYYYVFKGWDKNVEGVNFNKINASVDIYPVFDPVHK